MSFSERSKALVESLRREIKVYQLVLRHPGTPWYAKAVLGLALAYFLSPIDLIPDFIPVLGQLDDLLIVPGLVALSLKLTPNEVIEKCREQVRAETESR